jgi:phosphoesterase RecJ-like protein
MNSVIEAVAPLFRDNQRFVLTTHVNPDGDGLGSEVALAEWLASRGKQVGIINYSVTPEVYLFLDPNHRIAKFREDLHAGIIASADVITVLDTNHPDRLRAMQPHVVKSKAVLVCVDHHLDPAPFARHYILDDDATSTGELIYRLLVHLNGPELPPLVAQALYCAVMTDTGSFRYPRVDPEIFRIAAHLIECGADPVGVYHEVYEQWSPGRIQLLGAALESLETTYGGKLAYITITQDMLRRTGTMEDDTDNFTSYPMSVKNVLAGILFLELRNGVKVSFRSKGHIPINELAREFGGNGHKNAAGARLYDVTVEPIRRHIIEAAKKYVDFAP